MFFRQIHQIITKASFSNFCTNMTKTALVFLAPGAEEMEFVIAVDVLRRGGVEVTIAGLPEKSNIICSRGVSISADVGICDVNSTYDALVLPGGLEGSKTLAECKKVGQLLKEQETSGRLIGAICAAPTALKAHGIGVGKSLTCYPAMKSVMSDNCGYTLKDEKVVVDGKLITSQGPGTAYDFALTLVAELVGKEKASEVAKGLLLDF